jgi:acyl carrier protein
MQDEKIRNWIIDYFVQTNKIDREEMLGLLDADYFELGYIDSMSLMAFVIEIENNFKIRFDAEHFQDKQFTNISGLSKMILNLI